MAAPRVGLFCKSCKSDLNWLYFALSSFKRNWLHDPSEILVVADLDCQPEMSRWEFEGVHRLYIKPWPDGYCHAMAMKLCADLFLRSCDLILLFDSDMLMPNQTTLEDMTTNGMPRLYYDDWHSDMDSETRRVAQQVWSPAVRRSIGRVPEVDWMVSPCWLYWATTFKGARSLIEYHTRMPFLQAVYSSQPYDWHQFTSHPMTFCDMQTLGIYAAEVQPHLYHLRKRTPTMSVPVQQGWSHDEGPTLVV